MQAWRDVEGKCCFFYHNHLRELLKLSNQLHDGTYKERPQKFFTIYEPKIREIMSIAFRDRVYQRSLNDVVIYPLIQKHLIYENMACQKGKGQHKALYKMISILTRYYNENGSDGWVLQCDIEGYYPNMAHWVAYDLFDRYLPRWAADRAKSIIDTFDGDVGFNPGSQIIQIVGIAALNDMDHYIKERRRMRFYERYMDDFCTLSNSKNELISLKCDIARIVGELDMKLHPKKTKIFKLSDGILFLGFVFRLNDNGKVVIHISPNKVKAERRKLRRMVSLVRKGKMKKKCVDEHFESWMVHACFGNSKRFRKKMICYYNSLWEENNDRTVDHKVQEVYC